MHILHTSSGCTSINQGQIQEFFQGGGGGGGGGPGFKKEGVQPLKLGQKEGVRTAPLDPPLGYALVSITIVWWFIKNLIS